MRMIFGLLIKIYQTLSSLFAPRCKFYPSCSNYAATAISRHGVKGLWLTARRILRCHPWSLGGVDYVDPALDSADARAALKTELTTEKVGA